MFTINQPNIVKLAEPEFGRPKRFYLWQNGNYFENGVEVSINPRNLRTWNSVLLYLTNLLRPQFGAVRNLVSLDTKQVVQCFKGIVANGKYVATGHEKLKYKKGAYKTPEERERKLRRATKKRLLYSNINLQQMSDVGICRKYDIIFFLMVSGRPCAPPIKIVLTDYDKIVWSKVMFEYFAYRLDVPEGIQYVCTVFGREILNPNQLQHGYVYVAVPCGDKFTPMDYMTIFEGYLPQLRPHKCSLSTIKLNSKKKKRKKTRNGMDACCDAIKCVDAECKTDDTVVETSFTAVPQASEHTQTSKNVYCEGVTCTDTVCQTSKGQETQTSNFEIKDGEIIIGNKRYVVFDENVGVMSYEYENEEQKRGKDIPMVDLLVDMTTKLSVFEIVENTEEGIIYAANSFINDIVLHLDQEIYSAIKDSPEAQGGSRIFLPVQKYVTSVAYHTEDADRSSVHIEQHVVGIEANLDAESSTMETDPSSMIKIEMNTFVKTLALKLGDEPVALPYKDRSLKNARNSVELSSGIGMVDEAVIQEDNESDEISASDDEEDIKTDAEEGAEVCRADNSRRNSLLEELYTKKAENGTDQMPAQSNEEYDGSRKSVSSEPSSKKSLKGVSDGNKKSASSGFSSKKSFKDVSDGNEKNSSSGFSSKKSLKDVSDGNEKTASSGFSSKKNLKDVSDGNKKTASSRSSSKKSSKDVSDCCKKSTGTSSERSSITSENSSKKSILDYHDERRDTRDNIDIVLSFDSVKDVFTSPNGAERPSTTASIFTQCSLEGKKTVSFHETAVDNESKGRKRYFSVDGVEVSGTESL